MSIKPNHLSITTMHYNEAGLLTSLVGIDGTTRAFDYDESGLMKKSREGKVSAIHYTYHHSNHKPIVIEDARGKTLLFYDKKANLKEQQLPNHQTITYTRDLQGNPVEIVDSLYGTSTLAYNSSGNLTKHTNAQAEVTTLSYDEHENLTTLTDIEGNETHYSYNSHNKLTQVAYPDGTTESYTYTALGKLLSHTDTLGATTHYTTDKADNLVAIQNPNGTQTHFSYDVEGRLQVELNPLKQETTYLYDPLDRVIASKDASDAMLVYGYNKHSTLESIIDPLGNTTAYAYDSQANLTQTRYPDQSSQATLYSLDDKPVMLTLKDHETLFMDYAPTGELKAIIGAEIALEYGYDSYQRLERLSTKQSNITLAYNTLGEVQTQTQDNIDIIERRIPHSYNSTLQFLDQSIEIGTDHKQRRTTITRNKTQHILLSYDHTKKNTKYQIS